MRAGDRRLERARELHRNGRVAEAQRLYEEVVAHDPRRHEAWSQLGRIWLQRLRYEDAVASLSRAAGLAPAVSEYHETLGIALAQVGQWEAAAQSMARAVTLEPQRAEAHYNLALVLQSMGPAYTQPALEALERAARLAPQNLQMRQWFATSLWRAGQLSAAVTEWREVVARDPGAVSSQVQLAMIHRMLGEHQVALDVATRALQKQPDSLEALTEMGAALAANARLDEAEDYLRRALDRDPNHGAALFNLSSALGQLGRADEGCVLLRRLLNLRPDDDDSRGVLLVLMNWSRGAEQQEILREATEFGARHPLRPTAATSAAPLDPGRRLRIGYFSADFSRLVAFLPGLFERHDRDSFEIVCYSGLASRDPDVLAMKPHVDRWLEVSNLSHAALAARIRADQIEVLVDLTMHMAGSRLQAFAEKPAPVQIAWLAYPGTTGIAAMDYRLTDPHLDSPDAASLPYSERSLWLPDTFWLYRERLADCEPGPLPAESNGVVTFGSLNGFAKYHDGLASTWAAVLRAVPGSKLLLLAPPGRSRDRVLRSFEEQGIEQSRVEFVAPMPLRQYFETYRRIDIALDTFPCNGHTTTMDAAWMGVPTVTLVAGSRVVGRGGLSIARNLGLSELASDCEAGYIRVAAELAGDRPRLGTLRESLRARLRTSPLMNAALFARNLEQIYRTAFQRWCDEQQESTHRQRSQ